MKRRSFISLLIGAVSCMAIAPADFLTPYSPAEQVARAGALTPQSFMEAAEYLARISGQRDIVFLHPKLYKMYCEILGEK